LRPAPVLYIGAGPWRDRDIDTPAKGQLMHIGGVNSYPTWETILDNSIHAALSGLPEFLPNSNKL